MCVSTWRRRERKEGPSQVGKRLTRKLRVCTLFSSLAIENHQKLLLSGQMTRQSCFTTILHGNTVDRLEVAATQATNFHYPPVFVQVQLQGVAACAISSRPQIQGTGEIQGLERWVCGRVDPHHPSLRITGSVSELGRKKRCAFTPQGRILGIKPQAHHLQ